MAHLLVALSAHGYGHIALTAPVVNTLRRHLPSLQLTLYTTLPHNILSDRFDGDFQLITRESDVNLHMKHALEVDRVASCRAYQDQHRHWDQAVANEKQLLNKLAPDAILSSIPYRILEAAAQSAIPALALCSLNWADIFMHYCGDLPVATDIHGQILSAYNKALAFLQPAPSMAMDNLTNRIPIGPITRTGLDRRTEIRQQLDINDKAKLIAVSLGGVPSQLNLKDWPVLPNVFWIVPAAWDPQRRDIITFETLAMKFIDVLCSADALITKPGYGSFVEATCNGIPVLYVSREDWPEQPYLTEWLHKLGRGKMIHPEQLKRGDFVAELEALLDLPPRAPVSASGIDTAAQHLLAVLPN